MGSDSMQRERRDRESSRLNTQLISYQLSQSLISKPSGAALKGKLAFFSFKSRLGLLNWNEARDQKFMMCFTLYWGLVVPLPIGKSNGQPELLDFTFGGKRK